MKRILNLVTRINGLQADEDECRRIEDRTRQDILNLARSNATPDLIEQKCRDARLSLDLAMGRREKLEGPLEEALRDLATDLRRHIDAWNSAIAQGIKAIEADVIAKNTEYFKGDEVECRRWWGRGNLPQMPIFYEWRLAFYPEETIGWRMRRDLIGTASDFLRHAQRHSEVLGLDLNKLTEAQ